VEDAPPSEVRLERAPSEVRLERAPSEGRLERAPRGERAAGPERSDRFDRGERSERMAGPERGERPGRGERAERDDYRARRRPVPEGSITESSRSRDDDEPSGWQPDPGGYGRRSGSEDPEFEPVESARPPRASRYGRGRRGTEERQLGEEAAPGTEERSADLSEGRSRRSSSDRAPDRDSAPVSSPDVLDFITKPAPGESPAGEPARGAAARVRRRRR
jgi:hypothetical protein